MGYTCRSWVSGGYLAAADLSAMDNQIAAGQIPAYAGSLLSYRAYWYSGQGWLSGSIVTQFKLRDMDSFAWQLQYPRYYDTTENSAGEWYTARGWGVGSNIPLLQIATMDSSLWESQRPRYADIFFNDKYCDTCGMQFDFGDTLLLKVTSVRPDGIYARPIHFKCTQINIDGEDRCRLRGQQH